MTLSTLKSTRLANSILDAFPSGSYAITGLLQLLDIVETESVPTAAVQCAVQPRLLINPVFVEQHAQTPEKLLMLVMHELHHVLLGHTTLFPRMTPAQNFVFDAVINGLLCRMFPAPAYTALFTGYYRDDRFPECLLRPPQGWVAEHGPGEFSLAPGVESLEASWRRRAWEIHAALYSEGGASYHEVHELLPRLLVRPGLGRQSGIAVPLLGGHDDEKIARVSPLLFDLVRELVEQWPQPPDPIRGRSLADLLQEKKVSPRRRASGRSMLRTLIRKLAGRHGQGRVRQFGPADTPAQTAIPYLSRRSAVLRAVGVPALLHETQIAWKRIRREGDRVHIYLDVSGSMDSVLGALYGAVLDCEALLWPRIHLFSTKVVDVTVAQLRSGQCRTTGGTDIDVVAAHMADHGIGRALIVTDGWVGKPAGRHRQVLQDACLAVAYLGNTINQDDLAAVAKHSAVLNAGDFS
jgi:hypothetical protein